MPAHRDAGDKYLGRRGKHAVVGRRYGRKLPVLVFNAGTNVVVVFE
jgi:hypothetical protein